MKFDAPVENRWTTQTCYLGPVYMDMVGPRWSLRLQLGSLSIGVPSSLHERDESLILGRIYFFMRALRVVLPGVRLREELLTHYVFLNSLGNEIWSIYNAKYSEM